MSAVQRQDKDAFASLMARHLDSLYGYALRLTQEPNNAEDLVQETWLRAWANAKKYKQGTQAIGVPRSAHNHALSSAISHMQLGILLNDNKFFRTAFKNYEAAIRYQRK